MNDTHRVPEHFGPYVINDTGTVWRIDVHGNPMKTPMRTKFNHDGYKMLGLRHEGKQRRFTVHQLMMMSWKPSIHTIGVSKGMTIDHINQNKTDNRLENLRMATGSQQNQNKNHANHVKGQRQPVDEFDIEGNFIMTHESSTAAAKARGIHQANISKCLRGKLCTTGKRQWRYHVKSSDADLPGEVWISRGGDFISTYGRFKRRRVHGSFGNVVHSYEMSLKGGYPTISFGRTHRRFHLHVAEAFLSKPDGWTPSWIVNHKDGNKLNARLENLEWNTQAANDRHARELGIKKAFVRPVRQYTSEGVLVADFPSVKIAANSNSKFIAPNISKCINRVAKSHAGYIWRAVDDDRDVSREIFRKKRMVPVRQYTHDGRLVEEFPSRIAAEQSNPSFRSQNISSCTKRKLKSHAGYIWRGIDDDEYDS